MTSRRAMIGRIALAALALVVCPLAPAQTAPIDDATFATMVARWNAILDFPETLLSDPDIRLHELEPLTENVVLVNELAQAARREAEANYGRQQKLLGALGPPPAEGEPAEAPEIADKRALLSQELAVYDARIKQAKIINARARDILRRIGDIEMEMIAGILGKRLPSPLSPATIAAGVREYPGEVRGFSRSVAAWWRGSRLADGAGDLVLAIALLVAGFVAVALVRGRLVSRFGAVPGIESPSLARRMQAIVVEALATIVLPILLVGAAAAIFIPTAQLPGRLEQNITVLAWAVVNYILVVGLAKASLASRNPRWRITSFTDEAAAGLERDLRRFAATVLVFNVLVVLVNPERGQVTSMEIIDFGAANSAVILVATLGIVASSLLALRVLRPLNWRFCRVGEDDGVEERPLPFNARLLFIAARATIVIGMALYLIGYLNLGLYFVGRTVLTLALIAIAVLLHGLVREGLGQATSTDNAFGRWVRQRFALHDAAAGRWAFWIVLMMDIVLVAVLAMILLYVWGVPWAEITAAMLNLVYGTEIGGHTFSLVNVGLALGTFVALMIAVRLLQGLLAERILVQTRLDVGVRDAVSAGVGYVGVVVAVLVALSLIGLKFGEIALIFSALSIGIGFGLQHVVNNFISGLILLVQRPIKAGDWIVVGAAAGASEGYVKRINVISTEITTFDNATVIVPNSQLMTSEVMNWTHRGRLGRVKVAVGVSYASDPEEVRALLLKCAGDNATVLSRPAPSVIFKDFGESSLDFELRVFIRDIDYVFQVASELRFAIKKALDEAGVEIPFPQRDVHVKSTPSGALPA